MVFLMDGLGGLTDEMHVTDMAEIYQERENRQMRLVAVQPLLSMTAFDFLDYIPDGGTAQYRVIVRPRADRRENFEERTMSTRHVIIQGGDLLTTIALARLREKIALKTHVKGDDRKKELAQFCRWKGDPLQKQAIRQAFLEMHGLQEQDTWQRIQEKTLIRLIEFDNRGYIKRTSGGSEGCRDKVILFELTEGNWGYVTSCNLRLLANATN